LAIIIHSIEKASQPNQLPDCKKLTGYKTAYRIKWANTVSDFILKIKLLNWYEYYTGKRSIAISFDTLSCQRSLRKPVNKQCCSLNKFWIFLQVNYFSRCMGPFA
jgi:hypothetical protein